MRRTQAGLLPFTAVSTCPFSLSLSGSQLILFTGVPIKLTQKAFEMAGGYLRRESGVTLGLSL